MMETNGEYTQLESFRNGDTAAFNQIYRRYYRRLCYFAAQLTGDQAQAEDIVADSMIKLWERHARFQTRRNIKAFLYITTRNACLDHLRKRVKEHDREKDLAYLTNVEEEYILTRLIETELLHEIYTQIEHLPYKAQTVFKLTYFNDYTTEEVALRLNMTLTAVRNNRFRALEALRLALVKRRVLNFTGFCGFIRIFFESFS